MRRVAVMIVTCAVLLTVSSCRSTLSVRSPSSGKSVGSLVSILKDPFRSEDSERFTLANSAMTLARSRAMPAAAVAGRSSFTLEDCRRIALANNLELQVNRADEFTKRAIEYSNKTKPLPHFLFTGDLSERDNPPYSFSDVLGQEGRNPNPGASGTGVTNYSTGHERSTWRYVLETRWSPTDAALAYYLSKSSINDSLKAHYQRVRVAQKLIAAVDAAFFRLLGLQQCAAQIDQLVASRSKVAVRMKDALDKRLVNVRDYNNAKQQLVRAERLLMKTGNQIEKQRNILASAMALSPDDCAPGGFSVVGELPDPAFNVALCDMEMRAVQNRPEGFEAGLGHLNSVNDLKRTIVKYAPRVSVVWRYTRDKDRFLYNKDWKEVGIAIYFDLLDWLSNHRESKAAASNADKTLREMGAVALGITSQVRVAALQYLDSMDDLESVGKALAGSRQVLEVAGTRAARDDLDKLSLEEARAAVLQDSVERTRALAEANAALGELQGAMGTNYNERPPDR